MYLNTALWQCVLDIQVIICSLLSLGTRWRWVVSFTIRLLYPVWNEPPRLAGPQLDAVVKRNISTSYSCIPSCRVISNVNILSIYQRIFIHTECQHTLRSKTTMLETRINKEWNLGPYDERIDLTSAYYIMVITTRQLIIYIEQFQDQVIQICKNEI